jgi:CheY-like chemotaxis protein
VRHGHRILLLEDDADDAKRSRDALVESGYAVTLAPSLTAARRAIRRHAAFDLVIVDHHLPDGEGPSIIPHLRAAGIRAPVVLVTANRSERVAEAAFEAGCVDTAVKDLGYHSWLPRVAQAFANGKPGSDPDWGWGLHVKGVCVGRVHGNALQASPPNVWESYHFALQSATELAIRCVRGSGQSALGSLPSVQVQVGPDLHLLVILRGGVFAAALLSKPATAADREELVEEASSFAKARAESEDLGAGTA